MIKTGNVEVGKTPSEVSGKKSELIKNGAAVCKNEDAEVRSEADLDISIKGLDS